MYTLLLLLSEILNNPEPPPATESSEYTDVE